MVYTEVKEEGQRCISTQWVCTEETAGEKVYIARLVDLRMICVVLERILQLVAKETCVL